MSFSAITSSLSAPAKRSVKLLLNFADAFRVARSAMHSRLDQG
jgi:hypothetical protein